MIIFIGSVWSRINNSFHFPAQFIELIAPSRGLLFPFTHTAKSYPYLGLPSGFLSMDKG